jgi:hypothetical protein
VIEEIVYLVTTGPPRRRLDEPCVVPPAALHEGRAEFAGLSGPAGRQLDVDHIAQVGLAALVCAVPHALEQATDMGPREAEQRYQPREFPVLHHPGSCHTHSFIACFDITSRRAAGRARPPL